MIWGAFTVGAVVGLLVFRALMGIAVALTEGAAALREIALLQRVRVQSLEDHARGTPEAVAAAEAAARQLCAFCGHARGDHAAGPCSNCLDCPGFTQGF